MPRRRSDQFGPAASIFGGEMHVSRRSFLVSAGMGATSIASQALAQHTTNNSGMSITLRIPDSVARGLRLPETEAEERLRCELALALYEQSILSFGKATEMAEVSRFSVRR